MTRDTTSGLGSDKLAQLLRLGADEQNVGDPEDSERQKARQLAALLNRSVPAKAVVIQTLPAIMQQVCQALESLSTSHMDEVLLDPNSDVAVIEPIKSYAKQLTKSASTDVEREVALVLYYAAIASALVFHNKHITKNSTAKLGKSFKRLSALAWVDKKIVGLLKDATTLCAKQVISDDPK